LDLRVVATCILIALLAAVAAPAAAGDYLDAGEVGAITAGTAGLVMLGRHLGDVGARRPPRWTEPPGFDRWVAETLAPAPRAEARNFMESDTAAAVNVLLAGAAVGVLDARHPVGESGKDVLQGQFLYYAGMLSLKGLQDAVKGTVARQRPLSRLAPEIAAKRAFVDAARDKRSFWSGHASSAFYASTFLDKRVRGAMRREMSAGDYDRWNWAPPVLLYGWAGWVAYSRIHAYQHYLSDVAVGAVAGWLFAELFCALDDRGRRTAGDAPAKDPFLTFSFGF